MKARNQSRWGWKMTDTAHKIFFGIIAMALTACSGSGGGSSDSGSGKSSVVEVPPAGIWVVNKGRFASLADNTVMRVDSASNAVTATFSAEGSPAKSSIKPTPVSVVFCGGSLWVGSYSDSTLDRISPTTNEVLETIPDVFSDAGMTCAENRIWANATSTRTVTIYDTKSKSKSTVELVASGSGIRSTSQGVWAVDLSQTLTQYDAVTFAPLYSTNINSAGTAYMPLGMTGSADMLFIVAKNNFTDKIALIKFNVVSKSIVYATDLAIPGLTDTGIALGQRLDVLEAEGMIWFPAGTM